MKSDLDHLPQKQQDELALIRTILLGEFEAALKEDGGGTQPWRRNGKILKIILFGSYARNDWVDEPENGYLSDFDLLIIVSNPKLTDIAQYWYIAEDKILRDPTIGRTVNIIVHDLDEVNQAIGRGEYFWTDIVRDGVTLYDLPGHPLATAKPLTPQAALTMAEGYYSEKSADVSVWLDEARTHLSLSPSSRTSRKHAAFRMHQAVEAAYICSLLVHTFYFPRSHNIKFLRSLAEDVDKSLIQAWPREQKLDRRRFEMLKRAYVEARYSEQYDVSSEDLEALMRSAKRLSDLVQASAVERIEALRSDA